MPAPGAGWSKKEQHLCKPCPTAARRLPSHCTRPWCVHPVHAQQLPTLCVHPYASNESWLHSKIGAQDAKAVQGWGCPVASSSAQRCAKPLGSTFLNLPFSHSPMAFNRRAWTPFWQLPASTLRLDPPLNRAFQWLACRHPPPLNLALKAVARWHALSPAPNVLLVERPTQQAQAMLSRPWTSM
jgi:hypothetical protein